LCNRSNRRTPRRSSSEVVDTLGTGTVGRGRRHRHNQGPKPHHLGRELVKLSQKGLACGTIKHERSLQRLLALDTADL